MNRQKLANILKALSPMEVNFQPLDSEIQKLKDKLKEQVVVKTLEDVQVQLERNRKLINFEPLLAAFDSLKQEVDDKNTELLNIINSKQEELNSLILDNSIDTENINRLSAEIKNLLARKVPDFGKQIKDTETRLMAIIDAAGNLDVLEDEKENTAIQAQFANFDNEFKRLKLEFQKRGGGSMNRQILVEGTDVLTRYTDINIYGVSSSVIAVVDNTNKRVNIGIQGGGGSASTLALQTNDTPNGSQSLLNLKQGTNITVADDGVGGVTISASAGSVVAGITRIASVISVSSTLAAAALTDYAIFANVGIQVTLPTAISNSNLYVIKNNANSSVLINTTAGQTIDGSSSALLPVQYQSLDLMSNGSIWAVI